MFNIDTLTNESVNTFNVFDSIDVEESFSITAIRFVEERAREYRECSKDLYRSILESGNNYEVINESFSDFFERVKGIIDKFIKFVKSLFQRFITALNKFVLSEKYLKKHKDDFKKFSDKHDFTIDGYTFDFDSNVPIIDALASFEKTFVELNFAELASMKDDPKRLEAISRKYAALTDQLKNDWYDRFRGEVIGKGRNHPISSGDFANDLFCLYRDGDSDKSSITITSSLISDALIRFENFKEFEKQTKKTKDTIEKEYEQIKKQVQSMVYRNRDNDINKLLGITVDSNYNGRPTGGAMVVSHEVMTKIDLFVKAKVNQIMEMSNIHSMAFSYKLDAIADCYRQDKHTLYTALNKIQKDTKA
jgi:hypothetical protein